VAQQKILPLLDGLDEIGWPNARSVIAALNDWHGPFVLTCRTADYDEFIQRFAVISSAPAIEVAPLTPANVARYLVSGGTSQGGDRWTAVVEAIGADPTGPAARALSLPLTLALARSVYSSPECDPAELVDKSRFPTRRSIEDGLVDEFIVAAYADKRERLAHIRKYLGVLPVCSPC